jgi:hypothetical protein
MQGPQEAVANATVDGGLVILGNGSQIRSTRVERETIEVSHTNGKSTF